MPRSVRRGGVCVDAVEVRGGAQDRRGTRLCGATMVMTMAGVALATMQVVVVVGDGGW